MCECHCPLCEKIMIENSKGKWVCPSCGEIK